MDKNPSEKPEKTEQFEDCHRIIGVWGDLSCPKLEEMLHCRSCPVFFSIANRLFERKPTAEYLHEWTEILAGEKKSEGADEKISSVIFQLGEEWFALSTQCFVEVVEVRPVHTVPHRSNEIFKGIINVRGEIDLYASLENILGIANVFDSAKGAASSKYTRMMVVEKDGERWAFSVHQILGIHRIDPEMWENVPSTVSNTGNNYIRGLFQWQNRKVGMIDEDLLFGALRRSISR